jgi:hypothetical protein
MGPAKRIGAGLKLLNKVPKKDIVKSIKKIDNLKNTFTSKAVKKTIQTAAAIHSAKDRVDNHAAKILKSNTSQKKVRKIAKK